jgi:hypothetical protein
MDCEFSLGETLFMFCNCKTLYFYAALRRKGADCFAPVDRYIGRPDDLENLSLDCFDISYVGW